MTERTICQMEVHPELIRLRRERAELFKKWLEIYGPNPFQPMQSQWMGCGNSSLVAALFGNIGSQPYKGPYEFTGGGNS